MRTKLKIFLVGLATFGFVQLLYWMDSLEFTVSSVLALIATWIAAYVFLPLDEQLAEERQLRREAEREVYKLKVQIEERTH